jgi:hypothetical protein
MVFTKHKMFAPAVLTTCLLVFSASPILAQDTTNPAGSRTVTSGQKMKLKGVVTRRDADTFTVRDMNGVDTVVRLDDKTSVKTKGGFLRSGNNYAQTSILRGLNLEIEGRGNGSGELLAEKIRFNESDMRVARAVESRAAPLEERASDTETKLSQVEANAQRLSGQLDELAAVSNAARGGAKAAQATADAAVAGVTATNERISALDDYTPQTTAAVNFKTGSAVLSPESKNDLGRHCRQGDELQSVRARSFGFCGFERFSEPQSRVESTSRGRGHSLPRRKPQHPAASDRDAVWLR